MVIYQNFALLFAQSSVGREYYVNCVHCKITYNANVYAYWKHIALIHHTVTDSTICFKFL